MSSRPARAMGNVRGLPQVVFTVVRNGGCKGVMGLAAQLDYVLSKAQHVIDPNKEVDRQSHLPAEFSEAKARAWAEGWDRRVASGHSMHMVASFPYGTDPEKVAGTMRAVCHEIFDQGRSRFDHIAAIHTDTGRPHAHIIVDRKNAQGEWFHFARDGEFTYDRVKDSIVAHAAAHGIEMVNSSKLSRGITTDAAQDRDRSRNPAVRGLAGELVSHGPAPYQNDPKERASYQVTVNSPQGVKTLWGKELSAAMSMSGAKTGDAIRITHEGKVPVQTRTRDGRIIETHRNQWAVDLPERGVSVSTGNTEQAQTGQTRSAEVKREAVLAHAKEYRTFAAAYDGLLPALSKGFAAAADLLERGLSLTPETLNQKDRIAMPDDQLLEEERTKALAIIAEAREQLGKVREAIPDLPPQERPAVEAGYFAAVRDVERITQGLDRPEYREPAHGTIYADGIREAVAVMDRNQLASALDGTGLDPDEVRARTSVEMRPAALEAYWIGKDVAKVAEAKGHDLGTEDGKRQAHDAVVAAYRAVEDQGRGRGVAVAVAVDSMPAATLQDNRDLVSVVEERQEKIAEIRDLANRDHLDHDQQQRLKDLVEDVLDEGDVREMRMGESAALAKIIPDKTERLDITQKYLEAERDSGRDRDAALTVVEKDRQLMALDEKLERLDAIERDNAEAAQARERNREEGHEW